MKITSHISCIFAIIAQIFLSSMAFSHDATCASSSSNATDGLGSVSNFSESCGYSNHHPSDLLVSHSHLSSDDTLIHPHTGFPPSPCTCSSSNSLSFLTGDYSVDARERKIPLTPIAYYYNGLSFTFLPNAPSLSTVLLTFQNDDGINERIRLLHLAEYSGRFTSTYLSKFLL